MPPIYSNLLLLDNLAFVGSSEEWSKEAHSYQKKAYLLAIVMLCVVILCLLLGYCLAHKAKCNWTSLARSRRYIRGAFALIMVPQFLVYLLVNFSSFVDYDEIVKQSCQELLFDDEDSVQKMFEYIDNHSRPVGASFEPLRLPTDFCDKNQREWESAFADIVNNSGFVTLSQNSDDVGCPRSQSFASSLEGATGGSETLAQLSGQLCSKGGQCHGCEDCMPIYAYYMSCKALQRTRSAAMTSCRSSSPDLVQCEPCFQDFEVEPALSINCADACLASDRKAIPNFIGGVSQGADSSGFASMCLKRSEVDHIRYAIRKVYLAKFLGMLGYGVFQGVEAASNLFPIAIGQVMGLQRGLIIAKILAPEQRLPGILLGASTVFSAPFLLALLGIFQSVVGNYMLSIAFLFLAGGLFIMLPIGNFHKANDGISDEGTIGPQTEKAAEAEFEIRKKIQIGLWFLAFIFVFLWLYISDILSAFIDSLADDERDQMKDFIISQLISHGVNLILGIFGKSLISFVFFLDGVVEFLVRDHVGEEQDKLKMMFMESRAVRMEHLCRIVGHSSFAQVAPVDAPTGDSSDTVLTGEAKEENESAAVP